MVRLSITIQITIITALCSGCFESKGIDPPHDRFIYPVATAVTNNGDYLMVVNSNFDLRYNAGTILMVDLQKVADTDGNINNEADVILKDRVLELGAYASDLKLTPDGSRALIPVRGESAVLVIDISNSGEIHCGEEDDLRCDDDHRIKSTEDFDLPIEPYMVTSADFTYLPNNNNQTVTMGFITHLAGGEVSLACLDKRTPPALIDVLDELPEAVSGIAVQPGTNILFVTSRREAKISRLRLVYGDAEFPCNRPYFYKLGTITVSGLSSGIDSRDVAFSPDGKYAFAANRSPDSLVIINTSEEDPSNKVVSIVEVGAEPSLVVPHMETDDDGNEKLYVYVVCYEANRIYVIDPERREKESIIITREGPHSLVFDPRRPKAYITHFVENTIGVIDLKTRTITQLIGETERPETHD